MYKQSGRNLGHQGNYARRVSALCLLPLVVILCGASPDYGTYDNAKYLKNYDGDTITFDLPGLPAIIGESINVRVAGIDTPEIRGKCAEEKQLARKAKTFVESILQTAGSIRLENIRRGKYFRIVARVTVDNRNLAEMLLAQGLAVPYDGGRKSAPWCG
ncbi:MAG: thermonuclease family protein [Nitrospinales bacterium]